MDDSLLIAQTAAGDARAFEAFVRRWEGPLFRFLVRVTGSEARAEDARQWTLLQVFRKASDYRGGSATVWLFRIAYRGGLRFRDREAAYGASSDSPLDALPDVRGDADPFEASASAEEQRAMRASYGDLDAGDRALVWLCVVESMPLEQAARILTIPASTLRHRLARALARLRAGVRRRTESIYSPGEPDGLS